MVRAAVRCRVDLAGGTLDIWPLGQMHPGSSTVNVAIDLSARVVARRRESGFEVRQAGSSRSGARPEELLSDPETALAALVALELGLPAVALELTSESPRGGGLGASSALTVAMLAAGELLACGRLLWSPERRAAVARDLEARLMGLPTGMQDHLPGQLGGALSIAHRAGGESVRRLDVDLAALGEHWLVGFTGQSHFSAANNWSILRRRFERDTDVVSRLDAIRDVAAALPEALEHGDWRESGRLVGREWEARRGLAPEVTTPRVEGLLALARELGAWGGKACGAGGGGSLVVLSPAARREAVAAAWAREGVEILAARPTAEGLETELG